MPFGTVLRTGLAASFLFHASLSFAATPIRVTGRVLAEKAGLPGAGVELYPAPAEATAEVPAGGSPAPVTVILKAQEKAP